MAARMLLIVAALAATIAMSSETAGASTIAYQCGDAVCTVDPDAGGAPKQLTANGRFAGITRDGKTAAWVEPTGNLVQVPLAGGAARTVFTGEVVNQPSMSPDGTRFLWSYPGPDGFGGLNATWVNRLTVGRPELDGVSFCSFCVTSHGWLGAATAIAGFPSDPERDPPEPSEVCRLASTEEEPEVSGSCVQVLASDARGGIGFPNANPAGTELVAVLSPGERTGIAGRIVRYSLATGAPIGDVTAGPADTTPVYSPEGDRVAFERGNKIVVKDLASGAERVLGDGVYPFWGGTRTVPVRVARTLSASSLRRARARVRVTCGAGCRVRASLRVDATTRRRLGLGRSSVIATASGSRAGSGTVRLRLKATRKARSRLTRRRSYGATVRVTITPRAGGMATTSSVAVRVRR